MVKEKSATMLQAAGSVDDSKETPVTVDEPKECNISGDTAENEENGEGEYSIEEYEKLVRPLTEEEKKPMRALLPRMSTRRFEDEWSFRKGLYWEDLQWSPLEDNQGDFFASKSMYIQVQQCKAIDCCLWYSVPIQDLLHVDGEVAELQPALGGEPQILRKAVAFPPDRIVTLGGTDISPPPPCTGMTKVLWVNVKEKDPVWNEYPPMRNHRNYPAVVVLEGKIYVFGGLTEPAYPEQEFGETLDEHLQQWYPFHYPKSPQLDKNIPGVFSLPPPPAGVHVVGAVKKHFAFYTAPYKHVFTSVYIFNLETGTVKLGESMFPMLDRGNAVFDGVLYAFVSQTKDVRAYDLNTKKWLPGPVIESSSIEYFGLNRLVHIGGNRLCVVESEPPCIQFRTSEGLQTRFSIYHVNRQADGGVKGEFISSRSYFFPNGCRIWESLII